MIGDTADDDTSLVKTRRHSLFAGRRHSMFAAVAPAGEETYANNPENAKPPWERRGVTVLLLESVMRVHGVSADMTTGEFCDAVIKPHTSARQCTFIDLFVDETNSDVLLGKPSYFISHWWGYKILDLVEMIREHDRELVAAGEAPAAYFFDMFILNQHELTKGCTSDEEKRTQLIDGLRLSLRACGNLLLCCMPGPTGAPGWERPAPMTRVWCLFEVFVAIREQVTLVVKLGSKDMTQFRIALNTTGLERVNKALAGLDARDACASVESDKGLILSEIEGAVGMEAFNRRVREGVLAEFKRIATRASMR